MPFCDIQNTPWKGPLFGVLVYIICNLRVFVKDKPQQEDSEQETMKSKDTEFSCQAPQILSVWGCESGVGKELKQSSEICCTRGIFDEGARRNTRQPRAHDLT